MSQQQNIFQLYESNIGILVPMIVETLKDAEQEYPMMWIEKAIKIAVERNARNWRYIETILKRWKADGFKDIQPNKLAYDADRERAKLRGWEEL